MWTIVDRILSGAGSKIAALCLAAVLEVLGDSFFQSSFYRSSGAPRVAWFAAGVLVLAGYGSLVNAPGGDFGRLLGIYVAVFFVAAQVVNLLRFGVAPQPSIWVGGMLIAAGGLVIAFWRA